MREADVHRAGALGAEDRVLRHPGGDIAQRAIVVGRPLVVVDLRLDRRRVIGRLLGKRLRHGESFGWNHWRSASALLSCVTMALPSPTSATSVGLLWPISSGAMSSWMTLTSLAKRGAWPKWKIQLKRAPIRKTTSACCSASVRAAATDSGWSSGITPLPIGERTNGICVRSMKARTSSSARDHAMPLPTRTSGRLAFSSRSSAASTFSCGATMRGGSGTRSTCDDLVEVAFALDDVVGHVEIAGAGAAIDRVPGRHLDVVGNALHALDAVRELAERRGDQHLALFLEGAHAAAIGLRGAADQDHRPAVLLGVGETGETVHDARAGHRDAGAGAAGQIAVGPGRVGGGLLVAHADVGDAFLLRRRGDRADRKPDDPEQVIDALLLEAPRDQGSAVDFAHCFLLVTE